MQSMTGIEDLISGGENLNNNALLENTRENATIVKAKDIKKIKQSGFNTEQYDYIAYQDLQKELENYARKSERIQLEITGKSYDGNDLYTVTITEPKEREIPQYSDLKSLMDNNPSEGQKWIGKNVNVKCPILIHASMHGSEFVGTDAVLKLIERFGFEEDAETMRILENFSLILNVNGNPDGRIEATRYNGAGVDLNRDFITQAQPETKAVVKQFSSLSPLVFLDLHGYVKQRGKEKHPGLILPGSLPHNPNYEHDLLYKWMLKQAEAMEEHLVSEKANFETELYQSMEGTHIPLRDSETGWDLYPPVYTPAYAMLNGSYAFTLEAPTNDWDGVKWLTDSVNGALSYAADNKQAMLFDQLEIYKRGIDGDHPNYQGEFPKAYLLQTDTADPTSVYKAVSHLIANGIKVEKAAAPFTVDGEWFQEGTYIVKLNQPKSALVNSWFWSGEDITDQVENMYDIAAWSLPVLWGFETYTSSEPVSAETVEVSQLEQQGKLYGNGTYAVPNTSVQAVKLVNTCLAQGISVKRDTEGTFYIKTDDKDFAEFALKSGLNIKSGNISEEAEPVKKRSIAILKDGGLNKGKSHAGTKLALEQLGFDITEIDAFVVARGGLEQFDVFFYTGTELLVSHGLEEKNKLFGLRDEDEFHLFKKHINQFVDSGRHFIGVGSGASQAAKLLELTDAEVNRGPKTGNGIVKVHHNASLLTSGYKQDDIGFVYGPVWYSNVEDAEVISLFQDDNDFFIAGHWKDRELAKGKPVIIREKERPVTLIGLEAGFRNHTDYLFRLLSNAVFFSE